MDDIASELKVAFETQYGWGADEKTRRLESLLLSKFLIDHALISTFCDRISKKRLRNLNTRLDMIFEAALKDGAPETPPEDTGHNVRGVRPSPDKRAHSGAFGSVILRTRTPRLP